jgi:dienelactone hydrolase
MEFEGATTRHAMVERRFVTARSGRRVPGVLWSPAEPGDGPLVLLGHGGSGSVDDDHVVAAARHLVREASASCVAIDGPVHGRRREGRGDDPALVLLEFTAQWSSDATMTEEMVADWRLVLDEVTSELGLGATAIGYWGLSMGTLLGLPLVAAEPRIDACVLGLAGAVGPSSELLVQAAAALAVPCFFLMQWDDELFSRDACLDLFDRLGSADKQLHVTPGRHSQVGAEAFDLSLRFLARRLALASAP